ncbi:hypothetical protein [Viscerimonas tarda]
MKTKQLLLSVFAVLLANTALGQTALVSDSNGNYKIGEDLVSGSAWGYGKMLNFSGCEWNTDPVWMAKYAVSSDVSEFRIGLGDDDADRLVIGRVTNFSNLAMYSFMTIGDKVGIGTDNPYYKLDVNGTLRAREIKVNLNTGADFVFEPNYQLKSLNEVHSFIKENKHLPEIPSAAEMTSGDTDLGVLQVKLLQKIEELTLYVIQQNDKIQTLELEMKELKNK